MNVKMEAEIDKEFNDKLLGYSQAENISVGVVDSDLLGKFNRKYELNHGTIIPLYFINRYYFEVIRYKEGE